MQHPKMRRIAQARKAREEAYNIDYPMPGSRKWKNWTKFEYNLLVKNHHRGMLFCMKLLNRSAGGIQDKAKQTGLGGLVRDDKSTDTAKDKR